jgi:nanoRNase/pAp phosphatase (c-di-AMP/oligoRNAs hydrolase)
VAVISTLETSDAAELADADILVGFKYLANPADIIAPQLALSFRSRNGYDVGALAVSLGGGGHKAAAGARVPVGRFGPYEEIKIIVNSWDAEQAPV